MGGAASHQILYAQNLIEYHELADTVQHLVVLCGGERHVVDDGRHVAEYRSVQQRGHDLHTAVRVSCSTLTAHHHAQSERLLAVGVGSHVPEPDAGHAGHGEVERRDVHRARAGTLLDLPDQMHYYKRAGQDSTNHRTV